ncbi:MAG: ABC transporter permease, partial [Verrucomicrobiota bacterium]
MSVRTETMSARAVAQEVGNALEVTLGGAWQITEPRPAWRELLAGRRPERVRLRAEDLDTWDSSLALFVFAAQQWCKAAGGQCDIDALPEKLRMLAGQLASAEETSVPVDRSENILTHVGIATVDTGRRLTDISRFVGECVLSTVQVLKAPQRFRWADCLREMQQCGAMALPIVSLISFLVGVTLAYVAAVLLRQFGADIYVADLIGKAMLREMGALMTAVVLAGRTGAAFAATLGNMKANEEIDAFETLGIAPVQFLVLPRMLALGLMMPLLALYANALGILGGMVVSMG